ncbi:hypothetical protein [Streptomyces yerevanensis]|uniref:hypothetical protein n=1 Tax=Streptomyces yerevanensis TaxID=66378 RepID=UPI000524104A|nr:hypothetical protein [Streptomyces yerevanensis]
MVIFQFGLEQLIQWRYGAMGVFCLLLITCGARTRNSTCLLFGTVLFVLLMLQA